MPGALQKRDVQRVAEWFRTWVLRRLLRARCAARSTVSEPIVYDSSWEPDGREPVELLWHDSCCRAEPHLSPASACHCWDRFPAAGREVTCH